MSKTKSFSIQAHLRDYTYTAKVNALTGELVEITAGCRHWTSFAQARKHYNGKRNIYYGYSWRDDDQSHLNGPGLADSTSNYYYRHEARAIIDHLDTMVTNYHDRLTRKSTRAEQAGILAKKVAKKSVKKPVKKVAKKKTK